MWVFSVTGLLFYTINRSLLSCVVYEALLKELSLHMCPNQRRSIKARRLSALIPLPKECNDIARIFLQEVDETAWQGPTWIPEGAREGCGGRSRASLTAVLNYHKQMLAAQLIRNAIQSPWPAHPLTVNSGDELPSPQFQQSCQWRSFSKQRLRVANLHRDWRSNSQAGLTELPPQDAWQRREMCWSVTPWREKRLLNILLNTGWHSYQNNI